MSNSNSNNNLTDNDWHLLVSDHDFYKSIGDYWVDDTDISDVLLLIMYSKSATDDELINIQRTFNGYMHNWVDISY